MHAYKYETQHANQQAVSQESELLFRCVAHSLRLIFITPEFYDPLYTPMNTNAAYANQHPAFRMYGL
jgi:hypothetical protein